jgi:hypothetical protein
MRVRQSIAGVWQFGAGTNNYLQANLAIDQNINTRLNSILGNCFFDLGAGIDWFNLLGSNQIVQLNLAVSTTILNITGVTGIIQNSFNITPQKEYTATYKVQTQYSTIASTFVFNTV